MDSESLWRFVEISKYRMAKHYLPKLQISIASLNREQLWSKESEHSNSIGGIVHHLLEHVERSKARILDPDIQFHSGIERYFPNEELEPSILISKVEAAFTAWEQAVYDADDECLDMFGLYHLIEHFSYHLGQIVDRAQRLNGTLFQFVQNGLNEKNLLQLVDQGMGLAPPDIQAEAPLNKRRTLVYLYKEGDSVISTGISFQDFLDGVGAIPNLLVLNPFEEVAGAQYHSSLGLYYLAGEEMKQIDPCMFGDFVWIDVEDLDDLDKLSDREKAELLYLGHYLKPMNSPYSSTLRNRYAYTSHDDDWYSRVYMKNTADYLGVIQQLFESHIYSLAQVLMPLTIAEALLHYANNGVAFDFERLKLTADGFEIPLYTELSFQLTDGMDHLINHFDRIAESSVQRMLCKKNQTWEII
ncbi:hypothetical protein [Paenibacillus gorillae]|uniref:hypothetical protein n=1 Tax=Paenibacillus gorillae TaxID=1243662 RepID=UPI0004B6D465|nr:hypothetical protein [Paenibacillus gorillae]